MIARENLKLRADVHALAAILETCKVQRQPPEQWKELWIHARGTPEYQKIANQYEPQLEKLETLADENEVREILRDFPASKHVN